MGPLYRKLAILVFITLTLIFLFLNSSDSLQKNWLYYADHDTTTTSSDSDSNTGDVPIIPHPFHDPFLFQKWNDHTRTCLDRTLTIHVTVGHGSYAIRCLLLSLHYALHLNRTLFISRAGPDDISWETIFLPLSPHCTFPPPAEYSSRKGSDIPGYLITEGSTEQDFAHIDHVWIDGSSCPLWKKVQFLQHKEIEHMATAAEILLRMNPHVEAEVTNVLSSFPRWNVTRYHAVHVRRGDKVYGTSAEAQLIPLEEYCRKIEKQAGTSDITDPVFVATDSIATVEEIKGVRSNWTWWYVDTPRYRRLRSGNFTHAHFFKWAMEDRVYWYKMFLAEVTMMRFAEDFVGTGSSNVWQLVVALRSGQKVDSLDKKKRKKK